MHNIKNVLNRRTVLASSVAAGLTVACGKKETDKSVSPSRKIETSDIIVIGAGLSGLNATLLLEEMGYSVTVLEGRNRVGGRVYTMDDVPAYPEGGASGIGSSYGRLIDVTSRLNVPLVGKRDYPSAYSDSKTAIMNLEGEMIKFEDWAEHPLNTFPDAYKDKLPFRIPFSEYYKDNPLSAVEDFLDPKFAEHDYSLFKYFKSKGFSDESIHLMLSTNQSYGDASGAHGISLLMMFNVLTNATSGRVEPLPGSPFTAKGGMMRIPEAMAKSVKGDIRFNSRVTGIRHEASHAEVHLESGDIYKAKRVIVTTPFSALRLVNLDAPITAPQSRAIRTLGYSHITLVAFQHTRNFWEDDNLPNGMWTDGPAGRMAPNFDSPEDRAKNMPMSFTMAVGGAMADQIDRLGPEKGPAYMLKYLERIRPSTKGALRLLRFQSWQRDPFAGGSYAAWKPGQITDFGATMADPAGRIHFAGEHTSKVTRGMEAAMESGERVAFEVAETI